MPAWSRLSAKCLRSRRSWGCKGLPRLSWRGPCVTFFALPGLVVVEAVQNSPCWLKVGRKGVFRACRESFVPGGPAGAVSGESFVPGGPSGAACWESFVPVGPAGAACWENFVPVGPAGAVSGESFVPVEASWHGARDRCESTVGTKGPAARAAGRMGASVSVVLGITGRCPAISHAIHCEHHAGLCQFGTLYHLCFGIACEIGGGARYWGGLWRAGCAPVKRVRACTGSESGRAPVLRMRVCPGPLSRACAGTYI